MGKELVMIMRLFDTSAMAIVKFALAIWPAAAPLTVTVT
jgi:hypothetical protein